MAPVEQYLMDSCSEIAPARSAAPDAISHDADVLVLGRHGYETAINYDMRPVRYGRVSLWSVSSLTCSELLHSGHAGIYD
jgi:hypothetical protein